METVKNIFTEGLAYEMLLKALKKRVSWLNSIKTKLEKRRWKEDKRVESMVVRGKRRYLIVSKKKGEDGKTQYDKIYANQRIFGEVIELCQQEYEKKLYRNILREIDVINNFFENWVPAELVQDDLLMTRIEFVKPIVQSKENYVEEWCSKEYEGLPFSPEDTSEFYTAKGERVRSKSEVMIADTLYRHNIPYKYECPITLQNHRTKYPDFTVLNVRTRREYIWEHLGMMTDPVYVESNLKKLKDYERNGIIQGDKLLLTMESHGCPLSTKNIEKVIETFLI